MCCREDPRPDDVLTANLLVRAPGSRQAAYWSLGGGEGDMPRYGGGLFEDT